MYIVANPRLTTLIFRGVYLPTYIQCEWLRQFDIKTVIDVGAYVGNFSKALSIVIPGVKIYSLEPIAKYSRIIKDKNIPNCVVVRAAANNRNGSALFYESSFPPASSLLPLKKEFRDKFPLKVKKEVQILTLNSYFGKRKLERKVFLKIDVQGMELNVLKGASKILDKIDIIYVETAREGIYQGEPNFSEVYSYLIKRGFRYFGEMLESEFYPNFGLKRYSNSLFLK